VEPDSPNECASKPPTIAVLTCDRPSGSYVDETLRQIDKEGGARLERRLYVDGSEEFAKRLRQRLSAMGRNGWEIVRLGEGLGSTEAMRRVVTESVATGRDLIFFEDDLLLCRNAVKRMIAQQVPDDVSFVTFFDMKEVAPGSAPGLYRRPAAGSHAPGFWGAQCLKFCPSALRCLASKDWRHDGNMNSPMASDIQLGWILSKFSEKPWLGVHIPNLVEHVGHSSGCFPGIGLAASYRRATNFPGQFFNADSLTQMA